MSELLFKYHLRISPHSRSIRFRVTPEHGLEVVIPQGYDPGQVPALLKRRQRWIRAALSGVTARVWVQADGCCRAIGCRRLARPGGYGEAGRQRRPDHGAQTEVGQL